MAYQLPDNIKGIQPVNEATAVDTLDYPFFFVCYGSSAGAKAPLVQYSSANLKRDIQKFINDITGIQTAALPAANAEAGVSVARAAAPMSVEQMEVVPVETLFDELHGTTIQAAVEFDCTGSEATVSSASNSMVSPGAQLSSIVKASNKNYLRIHTDIEKGSVIGGSIHVQVESESPNYGESTIYWREVDGKKYLDVTVRAVPCAVHLSYLGTITQ